MTDERAVALSASDSMREALMDQVSFGCVAEDIADQLAESLARVLDYPGDPRGDLAEGLARLGCCPDGIEDAIHEAVERRARKAADSLIHAGLPLADRGMPDGAVVALRKVRARLRQDAAEGIAAARETVSCAYDDCGAPAVGLGTRPDLCRDCGDEEAGRYAEP